MNYESRLTLSLYSKWCLVWWTYSSFTVYLCRRDCFTTVYLFVFYCSCISANACLSVYLFISTGSSCTSISRKQWEGLRLPMTGPPSLLPLSSLDPAPPAFQVCLSTVCQLYSTKCKVKGCMLESSVRFPTSLPINEYYSFKNKIIIIRSKICIKLAFICVSTTQSPSPTTPANQTVAFQRWHHQATPAPRVSSAPSSLTPGGEERKERCEHTNTLFSILSCGGPVHL